MAIDQNLLSYATQRQVEFLEAIEKHGTMNAAAMAMGLSAGTISNAMAALKAKAARMGYAPGHWTGGVAPGYVTGKVTVAVNAKTGEVERYWQRQHPEASQLEAAMRAAAEAMAEALPRVHAAPVPADVRAELCNLYTFTDYHLGMLANAKETLEANWDLKIAERTLVAAFAHMIEAAPPAGTAFVAQLGDFLHSDGSGGMQPITPTHGFVLDQDGRFPKIVGIAIRVLRRIIDFALLRHEKVVVLMAEGNHDIASSVWLRAMFKALYEHEPRVEVVDSELPYYVYQHGTNMLCFHHGHLKKNEQLPLMFAARFPKMWGETTRRVIHTGHRHHKDEKEHNGITVVQHRTLAAPDSHSARHGYVSERTAQTITYHAKFGEVARNTVTPEMFEETA